MNDAFSILRETTFLGDLSATKERSVRLDDYCEKIHHPSGLDVIVFPKKSVMTYAMLVVRFGAADRHFLIGDQEITLPDGVAHFLEHKLFARPDGSDVNEQFSAMGAEANAWTDYDKTAYLFTTAEPADAPLQTLMEFVFTPYFTKKNVAHERGIIREEIAMGEDDPWQCLYEQSMRAMYAHHPVRRKICGTPASIGRITEKLLRTTHEAFYRPDNMYLVVCGDIDMKRVLDAIDLPLAALSLSPKTPVKRLFEPEGDKILHRYVKKAGRVAKTLFQISFKDCPMPTEPISRARREVIMDLLSEMLFCRAGAFYHDLFERGMITPSYSYGYSTLGGENGIAYHAVSGETDNPDAVFAAYDAYIERIRQCGLDREDFDRCRRVLYAGFVSEFDFVDDIAELMCETHGNGNGLFDTQLALQQVTFEDVCAAFCTAFDKKTTVYSAILPK